MITNIDTRLLNFITENIRSEFLDNIIPTITKLGNAGFIWIVVAIMLIVYKKTRLGGYATALSLLLSVIMCNLLIKNLVARPRPFAGLDDIVLLINMPGEYSFPSGHATSSFAAAVSLLYINKKIGIPALIIAFTIAFSRIYLYVHYVSDVLFGAILGTLFAIVAHKIVKKVVEIKHEGYIR
ncbi:MAG: hypothetical protein K0R15_991 [Clostridiales bacterium]|jgi:undecaprenyl-diphosphatase|nr:hypothetical protein [Clostridiales bacterium]